MTHGYTNIKAGLAQTISLWEKRHDDETKTQVVVEDQTDNVREDDPQYVISAKHLTADGSQERLNKTIIDWTHEEDAALDRAAEWMADHPAGLSADT